MFKWRFTFFRLCKHLAFGRPRRFFAKLCTHKYNHIYICSPNGKIVKRYFVNGLRVNFEGKNSVIKIYAPCKFKDCFFAVGDNNVIEIKPTKYRIKKLCVPAKMSQYSKLYIGTDCSVEGCDIFLQDEPYSQVIIGDDCMLSFDIVLWPSDGHTIYDIKTKKVLNKPNNGIVIGNHCWIGRGCSFLKDSAISDNTVCGAMSMITHVFQDSECVIAGAPAKVIKTDVNWDRKNTYNYTNKPK